MGRDMQSRQRYVRYLHEVLFSLNLAFMSVSIAFGALPALSVPFAHVEVRINEFLHIQQTDFIRGYLEFLIPSLILAFCIWVMLVLSSRTRLTEEFLPSATGLVILFAPPAFWFYVYHRNGWPFGWPYRGAPFELTLVLFCALLFLYGKWTVPGWAGALILATHYVFWYWLPGAKFHMPNWDIPNYAGPIASILGFCSALAWALYISRLRQARATVISVA